MNMNSAKENTTKNHKSATAKSAADVSSQATQLQKNPPNNSMIDSKKAIAPKPVTPVSTPAPAAAKASNITAKATEARTPTQAPVTRLATPPAPVPKAAALQDRQALAPKSAVSAPKAATIEARIDAGFGNTVYLRGKGPGLSWDRGVPCVCVNRNTWRWTAPIAEKVTVKLLLNDSVWAQGADLVVGPGEKVEVVPAF